jgi:hypothetical protein
MAANNNETWTHWTVETSPVTPVPEPETYAMFLTGLCLFGASVKRRKAKQAVVIGAHANGSLGSRSWM